MNPQLLALAPFALLGALILLGALYASLLTWWRDHLARLNRARMDRVEELLADRPVTVPAMVEADRTLDEIQRTQARIGEIDRKLGRAA